MPDAAALRLAEAVAERICHDLAGLAGVVMTQADLAADGGTDPESLADLRQAARELAQRLSLLRHVFAGGFDAVPMAELRHVLSGSGLLRRAVLEFDPMTGQATLPPAQARVLMGVLLLAAEACRAGGTVTVAGQPDGTLLVMLPSVGAAWPGTLTASLAGQTGAPDHRSALAQATVRAARAAGVPIDLLLAGPPALLIGPPG